MKLFVTGGAGFIGSNYVRHVLEHTDDEVTVFDALTYAGNLDNLERTSTTTPGTGFVKGDICDRDAVRAGDGRARRGRALRRREPRRPLDRRPDAFVRTNCDGTNVICDVARRVGVERFLHISTDEVYGSIEEGSFTETDPLEPRSPYSASKAGSDLIALAYHETYGLPVVVTRRRTTSGRTSTPRRSSRSSSPTCSTAEGAALRRRPQRARLVLRRRQLRRGRPRAAPRRDRRDLQHRRRQRDHQPRARPTAARLSARTSR